MTPSEEYITYICSLYGDSYDDREEDSKPKGRDWMPGGSWTTMGRRDRLILIVTDC